MLAAIGITIVLKQLPVAFGVDRRPDATSPADWPSWRRGDRRGVARPAVRMEAHAAGAATSCLAGAGRGRRRQRALAAAFARFSRACSAPTHTSSTCRSAASARCGCALPRADFARLVEHGDLDRRATIAIVASIETLLSVQAVDRLDPLKRHSPPDRELLAQGTANAVSGFLGGLPVTAVIVRSGANVAAGGRERMSALVHGVLLLVAVVFAGALLNAIPLACLAAVLIQVGLNLCKPALFSTQVRLGATQLLPFAITIVAVLALDLLKGVIVGIVVGIGLRALRELQARGRRRARR